MTEERWARLSDGPHEITLVADYCDDALTELEGWYGGAEIRLENRANRLGDGAFPRRTVRGGRKLTLKGIVQRSTREEIERFERLLSGLFPSGDSKGWIEAENSTGVLRAEGIEPDGEPRISTNLDYRWCKFELPIYSPDPRLYGPTQQTTAWIGGIGEGLEFPLFDDGDGVTTNVIEFGNSGFAAPASLANLGNAKAYPLVVVEGTFPSGLVVRLTSGGRVFGVTYGGPVTPASPLIVDFRGSVTMNGIDQSRYLTERNWDGVDPNEMVTLDLSAVSGGAGSARLELRSTYL